MVGSSYIWSTNTFLYDIKEPRYKLIKMGCQIKKNSIGQISVLKSDVPYYCQPPVLVLRLGVDFVLPLLQEQQEEEE